MSKMLRVAIVVSVAVVGPVLAETPSMHLPNTYTWYWLQLCRVPHSLYFQCDYTSKTCLRGRAHGKRFAGVLLGEDRQIVLAHMFCDGFVCINADNGEAFFMNGEPNPRLNRRQEEDMTAAGVEDMREAVRDTCLPQDQVPPQ